VTLLLLDTCHGCFSIQAVKAAREEIQLIRGEVPRRCWENRPETTFLLRFKLVFWVLDFVL
jgi:hypothetical protein